MKKFFKILGHSVFASVLVLGGWGLTDIGSFFGEPARIAFLFLLLARNAAETLSLRMDPLSSRMKLSGLQIWIPVLSQLTMVFLCWFLPFADRRNILTIARGEPARYVGLALFLAGGAIQFVALRTLGREYSVHVTLQEGHRLVRAGIYRMIRHPMYLGLLLCMCGSPLVFRSGLVLPVLVLSVLFVVARIKREEILLGQEFGSEYEVYRERTKLLVPYLC